MADKTEFAEISILPRTLGQVSEEVERERRELLVARCGERLIGVFADEAEHVTVWRQPTPLPGAPPSVMGVVGVRGRISTVLDPLVLLDERHKGEKSAFSFIITLRGEEQLALAVGQAGRIINIFTDEVKPVGSSENISVVRGLIESEGKLIAVLNLSELFNAAMRGTDRRRKRQK